MKNIYLSGGGNEQASFSLDRYFFGEIPVGGKLLYIPIALVGHRLYATAPQWFTKLVRMHNREDLTITAAKNFADVTDKLLEYDAIYIGGGNTNTLNKRAHESGFAEALQDYIKKGRGVVYGGSAGAILLGRYLDTCKEIDVINTPGLDLLNDYSIFCHYEGQDISDWQQHHDGRAITLAENEGIIFNKQSIVLKTRTN